MSINLGNIWSKRAKNIRISGQNQAKPASKGRGKAKIRKTNYRSGRARWGPTTWILFHTIAAKINEEYYKKNYMYVWNFITEICANLPCPYCRNHAISFTKNIQPNQINEKHKLIKILFDFHNVANRNANNPLYNWGDMKIYNNTNVLNVFRNFNSKFFGFYYNHREFSQWIRNSLKESSLQFLNTKIKYC